MIFPLQSNCIWVTVQIRLTCLQPGKECMRDIQGKINIQSFFLSTSSQGGRFEHGKLKVCCQTGSFGQWFRELGNLSIKYYRKRERVLSIILNLWLRMAFVKKGGGTKWLSDFKKRMQPWGKNWEWKSYNSGPLKKPVEKCLNFEGTSRFIAAFAKRQKGIVGGNRERKYSGFSLFLGLGTACQPR